jgi:hypothetical protein
MKRTPSCREVAALLSHQIDQPLGRWTRLRLRVHLWTCTNCQRVERQFAQLKLATAQWLGEQHR